LGFGITPIINYYDFFYQFHRELSERLQKELGLVQTISNGSYNREVWGHRILQVEKVKKINNLA
jgi:hypothetical protein